MITVLLILIVCILLFGAAVMRNILGLVFLVALLLLAGTFGVEWARENEGNAKVLGAAAMTFAVLVLWSALDGRKRRKQKDED